MSYLVENRQNTKLLQQKPQRLREESFIWYPFIQKRSLKNKKFTVLLYTVVYYIVYKANLIYNIYLLLIFVHPLRLYHIVILQGCLWTYVIFGQGSSNSSRSWALAYTQNTPMQHAHIIYNASLIQPKDRHQIWPIGLLYELRVRKYKKCKIWTVEKWSLNHGICDESIVIQMVTNMEKQNYCYHTFTVIKSWLVFIRNGLCCETQNCPQTYIKQNLRSDVRSKKRIVNIHSQIHK